MQYLGITQATAQWLLSHSSLIDAVERSLDLTEQIKALRITEVVEGPLRISGSSDGRLVALWNADYLTGTGAEDWGFILLRNHFGLLGESSIRREVFERCLHVIDQRLRGLILDSALIHRSWDNGIHTCLAGRGEDARHYSIAYTESDLKLRATGTRSVICMGPSKEFEPLVAAISEHKSILPALVSSANELLAPLRRKPLQDTNAFQTIHKALQQALPRPKPSPTGLTVPIKTVTPDVRDTYRTLGWTYDEWTSPQSPLSPIQRRILESDAMLQHPVRIVGPGGSGKSLLMQLLAIRRLHDAKLSGQAVQVLYVVHNAAMARNLADRFHILGAQEFLEGSQWKLTVCTLSEYGKKQIELQDSSVIDVDAHQTKLFQLTQVADALKKTLESNLERIQESPLLRQVANDENVFNVFAKLLMTEISTAIKGHGLVNDSEKYINSERPLSRLHGLMKQMERRVAFDAFREYHRVVFEHFQVLDADDIALSLLGRLRTPIWELKRRSLGFDYVFVDETQLFNENERRLFTLLTKGNRSHVPIVLALDEAQEIYGQSTAGLGALGISSISNENLPSNYRSTRSIVSLAFFVIQRTTDLFGPDFPDFTGFVNSMEPDTHPLAADPSFELVPEQGGLGKFVIKRIRELRRANVRQIAVICHSDVYWTDLENELKQAHNIELHVLLQRGDRLNPDEPLVVLSRPAYVGGQEFDAVIAVGLEQGLVPPRIHDNDALAAAVEQQALREMYLSFTRARFRLMVVVNKGAAPSTVLQEAKENGLIA